MGGLNNVQTVDMGSIDGNIETFSQVSMLICTPC